jgi:hypothetical protein
MSNWPTDPGLIFWLLAGLHLLGLATMFLSRLPHSHRVHFLIWHLFLASFVIVGIATVLAISAGNNYWVWSGTVFSMMAVGSTVELGQPTQARSASEG